MGRERLPDPYSTGGGRRPAVEPFSRPVRSDTEPRPSLRRLLLEMWAGRLLLGAVAVKILVGLWRLTGALPGVMQVVSGVATLALVVSLGWFAWRLFQQIKRRLLWRVRRKLILSYIFIGVIPSLLILVFFLFAGSLVFMNVSAYLFKDGYDSIIEDARVGAVAGASEIARNPGGAQETLDRVQGLRIGKYPDVSVAFLPRNGRPLTVGPWKVLPPPPLVPAWITTDGFAGTVGVPDLRTPGEETLVVRAVAKIAGPAGGSVVVDVPIDPSLIERLHASTGVSLHSVFSLAATGSSAGGRAVEPSSAPNQGGGFLFKNSLAQLDVYNWTTGDRHQDFLALSYSLRALYTHLSSAQSVVMASGMPLADAMVFALVAIGVLFFIIEIVALVMGLALARSITSAVHQLFSGTERVRHGDFTNRIRVESRDQLGELAESFNQMTGSIENLLQTAAEKKRLEEELRIARQIQMSLLPRGPLAFPGISVTALCVPAREVGGDYYDFFPLGDRQLGVLIADVSGKGTSAALYMAELKGLVLSLSQIYRSPRQMLMEVNRIISENLDTRSFITMTYGVLDLVEGVLTFARAGHTPLLYLPSGDQAGAQVLTPSGIVVGLRIPGANEKFADLLEEDRVQLQRGDVFVLFTDGITEAMNRDSELFGETRLAALVSEHGHLDAAELRERILREIESFVGGADQHDDMTMILMKVEGAAVGEQLAV